MLFVPSFEKYTPVAFSEDSESLLSESEHSTISRTSSPTCFPKWFIALLVLIPLALGTLSGLWIGQRLPTNLDTTCAQHTSKFSPILDDIQISYGIVQFDGSFTKENVYRQDAGLEVDDAWEALGVGYRPMIVPSSQAERSGLTPDHAQVSEKHGGGFPVFMEGLHQLHCLNLLRKSLYYNYDHYHSSGEGAFGDPDDTVRFHVSHCLDMLRQRLMCTVDTSVFGQVWVNQTRPQTFVDFNTAHVCKNFDTIRQWAKRNQVPETLPDDYLSPPGEGVKIYESAP